MIIWTIVRFPNGDWSGGGDFNDPDYECCEKWHIEADSYESARTKAQRKRAYQQKKGETRMNDHDRETIAHALGLDFRNGHRIRWSYRNRYCGQNEICDDLAERGLMIRRDLLPTLNGEPQTWYHVTNSGISSAGLNNRVRNEDRQK